MVQRISLVSSKAGVFVMLLGAVLGCTPKAAPPVSVAARKETKATKEEPDAAQLRIPSIKKDAAESDETAPTAPAPVDSAPEESPAPASTKPSVTKVVPAGPLPPAWMPREQPVVILSKEHEQASVVKVGDRMSDLELQEQDGQPVSLRTYYGPKLTVVTFWNSSRPLAKEQLARLPAEVIGPFTGHGVNVIAINTNEPVADAFKTFQELVPQDQPQPIALFDPEGVAFAKVAASNLPRVYLLDKDGKILWFDLEYSRFTQRELRNALLFFLTKAT